MSLAILFNLSSSIMILVFPLMDRMLDWSNLLHAESDSSNTIFFTPSWCYKIHTNLYKCVI